MKTTIELPDALAAQARREAAERGLTLRSLVEEALRRELDRLRERPTWTPRRDLTYGSGGLTDEAEAMSWGDIRELASERG